jgi:acetoin utilization deacetylase AcuC-like enzyme
MVLHLQLYLSTMYSVAFHPDYVHPVPPGHRFPMEKYELLPMQLMHRGVVGAPQFFEPGLASAAIAKRVHDSDYVDRFVAQKLTYQDGRRIGFVQDEAIIRRELRLVQGTISGALNAFRDGVAFNIAGGTHHACYAHGEGFCMLNDQSIAAQYLLDQQLVKKVLIVDLDVHQGNGTADIFSGRTDVFTFSMHCEDNYPFKKSASHLDIGLPKGCSGEEYLASLKSALAAISTRFAPEFIFYQAGVDVLAGDKLGKLNCSLEACAERDKIVFEFARALKIPVQVSMGGGYAPNIATILEAHTQTYLMANLVFL